MDASRAEIAESSWKSFYRIGAGAGLVVVLVGLLDVILTVTSGETAVAPGTFPASLWLVRLHEHWFLGLRDLGLWNIVTNVMAVPALVALYGAHRRVSPAYALLAAIILFMGSAIYISSNTVLPMLSLSSRYAVAVEPQRSQIAAAATALLAQGEDLTPGTFMGFFLTEIASVMISVVMLRARIFGRPTAVIGIVGFALLLVFNIYAAFMPERYDVAMTIAMVGGPLATVWYLLVARTLFRLAGAPS